MARLKKVSNKESAAKKKARADRVRAKYGSGSSPKIITKKGKGGTIVSGVTVGGSRGGGTRRVSASDIAKMNKAAQQARAAEEQRVAEEAAKKEKARIADLQEKLRLAGARRQQQIIRDQKTGEIKRVITTWTGMGQKIKVYDDRLTGNVFTKTFKGGRVSGGLTERRQTSSEVKTIEKELNDSGLKPIKRNGEVVGFSSPLTGKTYRYTEAGINAFNRDAPSAQQAAEIKEIFKVDGMSVKPKTWYDKYYFDMAKKGDRVIATAGRNLKNNLKKFGINVDAIKGKGQTFIKTALKTQAKYFDPNKKYGVNSAIVPPGYLRELNKLNRTLSISQQKKALNYLKKEIPNLRVEASARLTNIPAKNRAALLEISDRIRKANPNLSDKQIQLKIRREMTAQTLGDGLEGAGLLASTVILSAGSILIEMGVATPILLKQLSSNPLLTLASLPPEIAKGLWKDTKIVGKVILPWHKGNPVSLTELVGEYWMMGKVFGFVGKGANAAGQKIAKLNPKYIKFVNGRYLVRKTPKEIFYVKGKPRYLAKRVGKIEGKVSKALGGKKRKGQFKKFQKDAGLALAEETVSSAAMAFGKQVSKYSGKELTLINAAANRLTSWIKRNNKVRKPIPKGKKFDGEAFAGDYFAFPPTIGALMKKFDSGKKLTTKEFIKVNTWLRKNVSDNITLLERSLYASEKSLRTSRLAAGNSRTANLIDIVRGNFKLRGNKPQVLIFEKQRIGKYPKKIQAIVNKIEKKGTKYNGFKKDLAELVKYQTQSGKDLWFSGGNPIYKGGIEKEFTLRPGSMIKRLKQAGFTYVNGKKVTFVYADAFKPSPSLLKRIKAAMDGRLTKQQVKAVEKELSKKLGRKAQIETPFVTKKVGKKMTKEARRADPNIPVIRIRAGGLFVLARRGLKSTRRVTRKPTARRTTTRKPTRRKPTPRKRTTKRTPSKRKPAKRPSAKRPTPRKPTPRKPSPRKPRPKRPTPRKPGRPPKRPGRTPPKTPKKPTPVPRPLRGYKRKTLSKPVQTYYVVEKVRGKFKKLYPKPLKANHARDLAAYKIDNRLSKTAFFVPLGKRKVVTTPPKNIQGYYSKVSRKLRPYKIRYGQKKLLVNGYIEKRKYFQDTKGERTQAARLRAKKKRVVKRKPVKRKVTKRKAPVRKVVKRKVVRKPVGKKRVVKRNTKKRVVRRRKK